MAMMPKVLKEEVKNKFMIALEYMKVLAQK